MQARDTDVKEYQRLLTVFLLLALALSLPYAIRHWQKEPLLFTADSYETLRMAQIIERSGIPESDPLVLVGAAYQPNLYHLVLAALFLVIPSLYASILVPIALGLVSFLLLYTILERLGVGFSYRFLALALLALSPPYLSTFTVLSPLGFSFFLSMVAGYRIVLRKSSVYLTLLVVAMIPFVSIPGAFLTGLLLAALFFFGQSKYPAAGMASLVVIPLSFIVGLVQYGAEALSLHLHPMKDFFIELGGFGGLGVFNLVLAVIGILFVWPHKKEFVPWLVVGPPLAILCLWNPGMLIYLMPLLALLGSFGFLRLYSMKWHLHQIRFLSILLVACGLIFAATIALSSSLSSGPDKSLKDALSWLGTQETGVVLTHETRAAWVQEFSGKKVVLAKKVVHDRTYAKALNDTNVLFASRNLEQTRRLLEKYNISTIVIDLEMRHGLVWNADDQGLLFLFRNSETFKRVYDLSGVEIWSYLGG